MTVGGEDWEKAAERQHLRRLRELEPDLTADEFNVLASLFNAHYYGYRYSLDPLSRQYGGQELAPCDRGLSAESVGRVRAAFLRQQDQLPTYYGDFPQVAEYARRMSKPIPGCGCLILVSTLVSLGVLMAHFVLS